MGRRRLHARHRGRVGRQRPARGLRARAGRISRHRGRARGLHRLAAGPGQAADASISSQRGIPFDGVWTSGIDNVIVDAFLESGAPLVPIVGADNAGFVSQLNSVRGLCVAQAVTTPRRRSRRGIARWAWNISTGGADANTVVLAIAVIMDERNRRGKCQRWKPSEPELESRVDEVQRSRSRAGRD